MSVESTLVERGKRYGDFADHAIIAQQLQDVMRKHEANGLVHWKKLTYVQRQALTVIADKIARILSGDPNYADNWHDIQGYAKLVEDRLPVETAVQPTLCRRCLLPHADEMPTEAADVVANHAATTTLDETAAQIDDESDRQKAVEQNGNDGAVYEDPWYGAPEWATHKAQDDTGAWWWYDEKPERLKTCWAGVGDKAEPVAGQVFPNPNWRDTLISR